MRARRKCIRYIPQARRSRFPSLSRAISRARWLERGAARILSLLLSPPRRPPQATLRRAADKKKQHLPPRNWPGKSAPYWRRGRSHTHASRALPAFFLLLPYLRNDCAYSYSDIVGVCNALDRLVLRARARPAAYECWIKVNDLCEEASTTGPWPSLQWIIILVPCTCRSVILLLLLLCRVLHIHQDDYLDAGSPRESGKM